jgi:hypothetical protein
MKTVQPSKPVLTLTDERDTKLTTFRDSLRVQGKSMLSLAERLHANTDKPLTEHERYLIRSAMYWRLRVAFDDVLAQYLVTGILELTDIAFDADV